MTRHDTRLRDRRLKLGLKVRAVAKRAGITHSHLSKVERGATASEPVLKSIEQVLRQEEHSRRRSADMGLTLTQKEEHMLERFRMQVRQHVKATDARASLLQWIDEMEGKARPLIPHGNVYLCPCCRHAVCLPEEEA